MLAAFALCAPACASQTAPTPAPAFDQAAGKAWAERCTDDDDWDKPGPAFHVYGDTYYVGTCGIAAILVKGDAGAIVIDGGPAGGGKLIANNIAALGFAPSDVKLLLHSHEHNDHAGGFAELKQLTGATLMASEAAAPVLASGTPGKGDPQFGYHATFPAVKVGGIAHDGEPVKLGRIALTPMATPGHTPGALSWSWTSCEGDVCKAIAYVDSLSPISSDDYRFSDHPDYLAAFRASIARVAALKCDILLTPHPSASGMREKLLAGDLAGAPTCAAYAAGLTKKLDARLAQEVAPGQTGT
ncbi:MAG: subclass B3 metallo-beta-lactamase [Candidatus Andeanibacterium colombiense]|uniref:Subclass B3 metallo-beta-lactamase n=1 Tax=Candidatus Andeanibacterium colombiense TaxID=3121345 RepID=A0AAJ6BN91_9SPHN|nr:MAG: subclass B3 metallo-beta-lactamase [Sphingomonadaceae bacterium]